VVRNDGYFWFASIKVVHQKQHAITGNPETELRDFISTKITETLKPFVDAYKGSWIGPEGCDFDGGSLSLSDIPYWSYLNQIYT